MWHWKQSKWRNVEGMVLLLSILPCAELGNGGLCPFFSASDSHPLSSSSPSVPLIHNVGRTRRNLNNDGSCLLSNITGSSRTSEGCGPWFLWSAVFRHPDRASSKRSFCETGGSLGSIVVTFPDVEN